MQALQQIEEKRGKAKIIASVITETKLGQKVKIVFVRHRHKRSWIPILSTDTELPDEEIVRIYGKRWDIEVFFKMMKHYLNLEREVQLRDYDGLIGHITIAMSRYVFLVYEQRHNKDPRTLGSLFYACMEELRDLSLIEAFQRIIRLAIDKIRTAGIGSEEVINAIMESVMSIAIDMLKNSQRLFQNNTIVTPG